MQRGTEAWDLSAEMSLIFNGALALLFVTLSSLLLAWLGIRSLATQSAPSHQYPEVNATFTCKSKRKHLAINLRNESRQTRQNCQNAAHLKVHRNEVDFYGRVKFLGFVVVVCLFWRDSAIPRLVKSMSISADETTGVPNFPAFWGLVGSLL